MTTGSGMLTPRVLGFLSLALLAIAPATAAVDGDASAPHKFAELYQARYGAAAVADDRFIYVLGGAHYHTRRVSAERIDTQTGEVSILEWELTPRRYHAAALVDDTVWIFGGQEDDMVVDAVEAIELASGQGVSTTMWRTPRQGTSAVVIDDRVWLLGGLASRDQQDTRGAMLEVFNPGDQSYALGTDLPEPVETRSVISDGVVYLVAGWEPNEGPSHRIYAMGMDEEWRRLRDLPLKTSAHAVAAADGFIYTFGDYEEMGRVARYDIEKEQWHIINVPYTPRRHAAAVVVGDAVYVIGGNTASGGNAFRLVEKFPLQMLSEAPVR